MCKETAAIAPVTIVILEAWVPATASDPAGSPLDVRGWRSGLRSWWGRVNLWAPYLAITVAYLIVHRLAGASGMKNLLYVDPFNQPLGFLKNVALGLPMMILAALTPIPPSLPMFVPESAPWLAAAGVLVTALFVWGTWPVMRTRLGAFCAAMFVISLLPQLATDTSERLLYFPFVFMAYWIAATIAHARPFASRINPRQNVSYPRRLRAFAWILVFCTVLPGFIYAALMPWSFAKSLSAPAQEMASAIPLIQQRQPRRVVLLNASGPFLTFYPSGILEHLTGKRTPVYVLSAMWAHTRLERLSERTFTLRVDRKGWLTNMFARIVRLDPSVSMEPRKSTGGFQARVEQTTPDKLDALAVTFEFEDRLESTDTLFLRWNGREFIPLLWEEIRPGDVVDLGNTTLRLSAL